MATRLVSLEGEKGSTKKCGKVRKDGAPCAGVIGGESDWQQSTENKKDREENISRVRSSSARHVGSVRSGLLPDLGALTGTISQPACQIPVANTTRPWEP